MPGKRIPGKKLNVHNRIFYGATEIEVDLVPADGLRANQGKHRTKLFDVGRRTPAGIKNNNSFNLVIAKCFQPSNLTWDHCVQSFVVWIPEIELMKFIQNDCQPIPQ